MKTKNILQAASIISILAIVSKIFGYFRVNLMAYYYGLSIDADAYTVAFGILEFPRELIAGGTLISAIIPVYRAIVVTGNARRIGEVASKLFSIFIVIMIVITLCWYLIGPLLFELILSSIQAVSDRFSVADTTVQLTISLLNIMFPVLIFFAAVSVGTAVLQSFQSFTAPATVPIALNIGIIGSIILLHNRIGIYSMAIGLVAGVLLQVTILLPGLKKNVKTWSFIKVTKDEALHEIWILLKPLLWGLLAYRIVFLCIKLLAMMQSEGDVAAFGYAEFIVFSFVNVIGISLATALFPTLSEYHARNKEQEFLSTIQSFFRIIFILTIPAVAMLINFRVPLVSILFFHGSFTWENTLRTANYLYLFSPIVAFESFIYVIRNAFYAVREMKTPVIIAIVSLCINFILIWFLIPRQGTSGIIMATSIAYGIHSISMLFFFVLKFRNFDLKSILHYVVKIVIASLIAVIFSHLSLMCTASFIKGGNYLRNSVHLGIAFFVFLVFFIIMARIFSISEITDLGQWLKRKSGLKSEG